MDWVETTGKTIEEASQRALEHLGVAQGDADIEVLEEPQKGLFGRVRGEARVRARVRPSGPRPKRTRRSGSRSGEGRSREEGGEKGGSNQPRSSNGSRGGGAQGQNRQPKRRPDRPENKPATAGKEQRSNTEDNMAEGITLAEQGAIAKTFLEGLLEAMELTATVSVKELDAETVEISVDNDPPTELGVLVGPRGTTLAALQEVTRTVVQAKSPSRTDRILVDVARYRERRVAALGRFANQVADEVVASNEERALEPMSAADRKAVHDALTEREGIVTRSEGEEPRRFVVVAPA
jgi:spoIIIJ-associated protein